MVEINLTPEQFNGEKLVDFYDGATMLTDLDELGKPEIKLRFWGAIIDEVYYHELLEIHQLPIIEKKGDVVVKGESFLALHSVMRVSMVPMDNGSQTNGTVWEIEDTPVTPRYIYSFEALVPNLSTQKFTIDSGALLCFCFNPDNCISYLDYLALPKSESFFGWKL